MPNILPSIEQETLDAQCFDLIRKAIWDGSLPMGQRLDVNELCDAFGVSKTPVVQAIKRLEVERLVEVHPRSGTYVRNFSPKDFCDIADVKLALGLFTVQQVAKIISAAPTGKSILLDLLKDTLVRTDWADKKEARAAGFHFESAIVASTSNPFLSLIIRRLDGLLRMVLHLGVQPRQMERQDFEKAIALIEADEWNVIVDLMQMQTEQWKSDLLTTLEKGTEKQPQQGES